MRPYIIAVTLFCSATGSRSLTAADGDANADGLAESVTRQLKAMPPAKCICKDGYTLTDGTCIRTMESEPQEICPVGNVVDGLCMLPAQAVLQCPDHYTTVCKKKDRVESPCCAKAEMAEKIARCPDGTEFKDGHCIRVITHKPVSECPLGFGLSEHGTQCIKEELGMPAPLCVPPDVMSPEGDSCITVTEQGFEYVCPDDYQCISHTIKKAKKYSPLCSACAKTTEAPPLCGCPEGLQEVNGSCYDPAIYALCQTRVAAPRKQAPSKKQAAYPSKEAPEPVIDCKPISAVACECQPPFSLECAGDVCRCLHRLVLPTMPVCRGEIDPAGNCLTPAKTRLLYTCPEGFTCDVVDKKGHCRCTRVIVADPIPRCLVGEPHDTRCIEVIREEKILDCPPGFTESCCDNQCTCTRTHLAVRQVKCEDGAVSIQGQCAYVSKPSLGCYEGMLRGDRCVQEVIVPPTCG